MINQEDIKVGNIVRHLGNPDTWEDPEAIKDSHFVISDIHNPSGDYFTKDTVYIRAVKSNKDLFELAVPAADITHPYRKELDTTCPSVLTDSIARPILAERKVGKVRMELVDDGFANALFEIAKLMTWANDNKGYLPHDWKRLPNAVEEFSSAASRHRIKPKLGEISDPESKMLHKVHEAFNVLAQLELMLAGGGYDAGSGNK